MQADYLIVGQGISGTFLSWNLLNEGKTVRVIDQLQPATASRVASGVINPLTGRRVVRTWMIDDLLPYARDAYGKLGEQFGLEFLHECSVLNFHSTLQMKDAFEQRVNEGEAFIRRGNEDEWKPYLNFIYGIGEVKPAYLVDIRLLLDAWRKHLQSLGLLSEEHFDHRELEITEGQVRYRDITAEKIIFCDGVSSFDHPLFQRLPFARNKGEALIVRIPGLPQGHILKQGISIVPWKEDLFWVGSSYQWAFENDLPTEGFRVKTQQALSFWLKLPFTIEDHLAAQRPATVERRPFVGLHPLEPAVGILNGLGTKGCSLAPWFAKELARHLVYNEPITPEADVKRFTRVLSRVAP
ncbi:MAG TPA: FAD-binding oxidoreductase [Chitinophagaceae bacterium]